MFTINCKGTLLTLDKPIVMGILNVNNNSFYTGSRHESTESALNKAKQMLDDGAAIIDIGGQSTHPESVAATAEEELERIIPVIETIVNELPDVIISVDTYFAKVAEAAVKSGAKIVNDISAGDLDDQMIETVAMLGVPFVAMHMKGTPQTMKNLSQYENLIQEISDYFIEKIDRCKKAGIKDIIVDPGFGFAKNAGQNFELLKNLSACKMLGKPLLAGLSRKSSIYKTLHTTPEKALNGTTVLNTVALQNGANILRVHDVKEAVETIILTERLKDC